MKALPSQSDLLKLLTLEDDGRLRFLPRSSDMFAGDASRKNHSMKKFNTVHAGQYADTEISNVGYRRVSLWQSRFSAHRIIWKLIHGVDPIIIDHIDQNRLNNRIENLREAGSHSINMRNAKLMSNNSSGYVGVHFSNTRKCWVASVVRADGMRVTAKRKTLEEAVAARAEMQTNQGYTDRHGTT